LIVPNIRDFLVEVDLNHLLDAPDSALARGMRSMISVPIVWGGRTRACVTLLSREYAFYGEWDRNLINDLPINEVVQTALHYHAGDEACFSEQISRNVWACDTNVKMAEYIVHQLANHFDWRHVALFEVCRRSNEVRLQAQTTRHPGDQIKAGYRRNIEFGGALGEACSIGRPMDYPDLPAIGEERDRVVPLHRWSRSLLCFPVPFRDRTRWILNVEDDHRHAFAKDEIKRLRRLFDAASGALQALAERHVLDAVVEGSSQGIIIMNEEGVVVRMNPEARRLLNIPTPTDGQEDDGIGNKVSDYISNPYMSRALLDARTRSAEEKIELRRADDSLAEVLMSVQPLENNFGRRVLFLKDLAPMQQLKERASVEAAFLEVTEQIRVPLSLAIGILRQAPARLEDGAITKYVDRASRQLAKGL
jgi:PAS domain-containing protein